MSAVGDIGRLTVEQLRKELTKYGLDKKGRKSVLLTRLLAFLDPEGDEEDDEDENVEEILPESSKSQDDNKDSNGEQISDNNLSKVDSTGENVSQAALVSCKSKAEDKQKGEGNEEVSGDMAVEKTDSNLSRDEAAEKTDSDLMDSHHVKVDMNVIDDNASLGDGQKDKEAADDKSQLDISLVSDEDDETIIDHKNECDVEGEIKPESGLADKTIDSLEEIPAAKIEVKEKNQMMDVDDFPENEDDGLDNCADKDNLDSSLMDSELNDTKECSIPNESSTDKINNADDAGEQSGQDTMEENENELDGQGLLDELVVVSEEEDEELTTEEAKPAAADVSVKTTTENADATKADAVSSDGNKKQKRYVLGEQEVSSINCRSLQKEMAYSARSMCVTAEDVLVTDVADGFLNELLQEKCRSYTLHCKVSHPPAPSKGHLDMVFKCQSVMESALEAIKKWKPDLKVSCHNRIITPSSLLRSLCNEDRAIGPIENIMCIVGPPSAKHEDKILSKFPDNEVVVGEDYNQRKKMKTGTIFVKYGSAAEAAQAVQDNQDIGGSDPDRIYFFLMKDTVESAHLSQNAEKGKPLAVNQMKAICNDIVLKRSALVRRCSKANKQQLENFEEAIKSIDELEQILHDDEELKNSLHLPGTHLHSRMLQSATSRQPNSFPRNSSYSRMQSMKTNRLREELTRKLMQLERDEDKDKKLRLEKQARMKKLEKERQERAKQRRKEREVHEKQRQEERREREKRKEAQRIKAEKRAEERRAEEKKAHERKAIEKARTTARRSHQGHSRERSDVSDHRASKRGAGDRREDLSKRPRLSLPSQERSRRRSPRHDDDRGRLEELLPQANEETANAISLLVGLSQALHGKNTSVDERDPLWSKVKDRRSNEFDRLKETEERKELERRKLAEQKRRDLERRQEIERKKDMERRAELDMRKKELERRQDILKRKEGERERENDRRAQPERKQILVQIKRQAALQREAELQRRAELERQAENDRDNLMQKRQDKDRYPLSTQRIDNERYTSYDADDRYSSLHSQHEDNRYSATSINQRTEADRYSSPVSNVRQNTSRYSPPSTTYRVEEERYKTSSESQRQDNNRYPVSDQYSTTAPSHSHQQQTDYYNSPTATATNYTSPPAARYDPTYPQQPAYTQRTVVPSSQHPIPTPYAGSGTHYNPNY